MHQDDQIIGNSTFKLFDRDPDFPFTSNFSLCWIKGHEVIVFDLTGKMIIDTICSETGLRVRMWTL